MTAWIDWPLFGHTTLQKQSLMLIGIFQVIQSGKLQLWPLGCVASLPYLGPDSTYQNSYLPEVLYLSKSPHHCLSAMETEPKDGLRTFYPNRRALTVKRNGCVSSSGCLSLLQVQQGGCKQRVIDEMLHVVLLTFLLGFGAHLISYILPRKLWKKNEESSFLTSIECLFQICRQINIKSIIWYLQVDISKTVRQTHHWYVCHWWSQSCYSKIEKQ